MSTVNNSQELCFIETVLIIGGTGMIGKALTQALIESAFKALLANHDLINKFENE